jgi:DNA/RNA endonuclease G (NUC1)
MVKYIGIVFFIFHAAFVFPCDLEGHFDFDVFNNEDLLYSGCYDAINKGPHIIEYVLTRERAEARGVRRPSVRFTQNRDGGYLRDILLLNGYFLPSHGDYTNSGYDRGHMAPNADFNDTQENALMTFFVGNIWPQTPHLNRVEWLAAENETRRLASAYEAVKVIIIVDEFTDYRVQDIRVPLVFKRRVYDASSGELLYEIDVYQFKIEE